MNGPRPPPKKRRKCNTPKISKKSSRGHSSKRHRSGVAIAVFPPLQSSAPSGPSLSPIVQKQTITLEKKLRNKASYASSKCAKKEEVVLTLLNHTTKLQSSIEDKDILCSKLKSDVNIAEARADFLSTRLSSRTSRFILSQEKTKAKHAQAITEYSHMVDTSNTTNQAALFNMASNHAVKTAMLKG